MSIHPTTSDLVLSEIASKSDEFLAEWVRELHCEMRQSIAVVYTRGLVEAEIERRAAAASALAAQRRHPIMQAYDAYISAKRAYHADATPKLLEALLAAEANWRETANPVRPVECVYTSYRLSPREVA